MNKIVGRELWVNLVRYIWYSVYIKSYVCVLVLKEFELVEVDTSILSRENIMSRISLVWWEYRVEMCIGE